MDIAKIRELVELVADSGVAELEIETKEMNLRIRSRDAETTAVVGPVAAVAPATAVPAAPAPAPAEPAVAEVPLRDVISPIVGTFYRAPSPESPPFASVGDKVSTGQTLCIVEAMKVMNEIDAEFSGTIKEVLLDDGSPVEAEAVMFLIDPS